MLFKRKTSLQYAKKKTILDNIYLQGEIVFYT